MASGIYILTFAEDVHYIGKSNNIDRRWNEHSTKLLKGTAAKQVQNAYNTYGEPEYKVLIHCHEDHIDLMESIFISENLDIGLVNTSNPKVLSQEDSNTLISSSDMLVFSTAVHIRLLRKQVKDIEDEKYKTKIEKAKFTKLLNKDKFISDMVEDLEQLEEDIDSEINKNKKLKQEIIELKSRTFWDYLLS